MEDMRQIFSRKYAENQLSEHQQKNFLTVDEAGVGNFFDKVINNSSIVRMDIFKSDYAWLSFDLLQRRSQLTAWSKHTAKSVYKHGNSYIFGYIEDNKYLGTIWLRIVKNDCHIVHFVVDPEHQKEGIGTKLLQKAIQFARSKHCTQMTLEVKADNFKARNLYRKNGFVIDFVKPRYYNSWSPKKYLSAVQNSIQPIAYHDNNNYHNSDAFHCIKYL